jgi:hypothetical protein
MNDLLPFLKVAYQFKYELVTKFDRRCQEEQHLYLKFVSLHVLSAKGLKQLTESNYPMLHQQSFVLLLLDF